MSGFTADWLAMREPFDRQARSSTLADYFLADIPTGTLVADLGAGAGSNIAYLRARCGDALRWRHVDADPALIEAARRRFVDFNGIEYMRLDLARELDRALDGVVAVTCAALIDLVSAAWIDAFVMALARARLPVLIALTYDGRVAWSPAHPLDRVVAGAFHRDMARDKGFGPALGPRAADYIADRLREAGALVELRETDWRIKTWQAPMLAAMREGIGDAAARAATPAERDAVAQWREARATAPRLALRIGHQDLSARWA